MLSNKAQALAMREALYRRVLELVKEAAAGHEGHVKIYFLQEPAYGYDETVEVLLFDGAYVDAQGYRDGIKSRSPELLGAIIDLMEASKYEVRKS